MKRSIITIGFVLISMALTAQVKTDTKNSNDTNNAAKTQETATLPLNTEDVKLDVVTDKPAPKSWIDDLKPIGWTSDYAHIFTQSQTQYLDSVIAQFNEESGNEFAIVTLDTLDAITIDNFDSVITVIGNKWKVGKKNKNNGLVIGVSLAVRRIRINYGSGLSDKLTDEKTKEIIDRVILPSFKNKQYFEGLQRGLFTLKSVISSQ